VSSTGGPERSGIEAEAARRLRDGYGVASTSKTPLLEPFIRQFQAYGDEVMASKLRSEVGGRIAELERTAWTYLTDSTAENHNRLCRAIGRPDAVLSDNGEQK
jgi:hypothetical protein